MADCFTWGSGRVWSKWVASYAPQATSMLGLTYQHPPEKRKITEFNTVSGPGILLFIGVLTYRYKSGIPR
jgi:hypothetical protein